MSNEKYSVDDRGNIAQFYELDQYGEWEQVACLDREAGPGKDCDSVTTWDGGEGITAWAIEKGYGPEIKGATKI